MITKEQVKDELINCLHKKNEESVSIAFNLGKTLGINKSKIPSNHFYNEIISEFALDHEEIFDTFYFVFFQNNLEKLKKKVEDYKKTPDNENILKSFLIGHKLYERTQMEN